MKKKIPNLKALAVVVVALVVAVIYLSLRHTVKNSNVTVFSDKTIDITPEQIQSIRQLGEWEFLSVSDEEMVDTVRKGFFRDDHLVRIYYGTLRLGVNLHETKPGWIQASGDSIIAILPPVKLLDEDFIDEARTQSFYESGRWTAEDREAMYKTAYRKMLNHCLTPSNIASAEANADSQFRQMLRSMGYNNVIVRFEKKAK